MEKKTYLITGASQGIGVETGRHLAAQGHQVLLVTRTEAKGKAAMEDILRKHPEARVYAFLGDMGLLRDVRRAQ